MPRPAGTFDGLDEAVPAHGQGGGPAVAGMPDGSPPGRGRHRADDPDAMRGRDGGRGRGGRGPGDPPHGRPRGRAAGDRLEAEGAAGEVILEHRERAVAAGISPPRRDQGVLQLPVGHEHPPVGIGDRGGTEPDRLAARPGDHSDAGQRAGQADRQPGGTGRGRREPARRAVRGQQPDPGALGRVLAGVRVRHLEPGHAERFREIPGGLVARGDVATAGARWSGGRRRFPGRGCPGPGGQVGGHREEDRRVELVEDAGADGPGIEYVLPVAGGPMGPGGRGVEARDE